ncbi:uncharacterized protein EDB91DRAFT_1077415 [Suillus paluster]|uniref:uncharacterized protein n=1 Tax=Suillus paluster TaxID=48578 RepID=UPI001B8693EF|nr:uncharacterized protein EDB91DRAFT_1077415 [Suillus paluster]KAG1753699.1 hypothetical protein EDB91DRAFT_1077415 [Suillus paluster]
MTSCLLIPSPVTLTPLPAHLNEGQVPKIIKQVVYLRSSSPTLRSREGSVSSKWPGTFKVCVQKVLANFLLADSSLYYLMGTHYTTSLTAFVFDGERIAPAEYGRHLKGALVQVYFTLSHKLVQINGTWDQGMYNNWTEAERKEEIIRGKLDVDRSQTDGDRNGEAGVIATSLMT